MTSSRGRVEANDVLAVLQVWSSPSSRLQDQLSSEVAAEPFRVFGLDEVVAHDAVVGHGFQAVLAGVASDFPAEVALAEGLVGVSSGGRPPRAFRSRLEDSREHLGAHGADRWM